MKRKYIDYYMQVAWLTSKLSTARLLNVGCIIVKDNRIISIGYNGTPSGWDNDCEIEVDGVLRTKPEVLHAEANALTKLARSSESGDGSSLFVTHSPCIECAKMIYQTGIKNLYYHYTYMSSKGDGLSFLNNTNIKVNRYWRDDDESMAWW